MALSGYVDSGRVDARIRSWPRAFPPTGDLRVVALGGGTGLPAVLRGLKTALFASDGDDAHGSDLDRITGIVTVADDGGSSGRLRRTYGVLPPGDIRNCLLALADCDPTLASLFDFRFPGRSEVGGHSLGNLILTALSALESDLLAAVQRAAEILRARGRVLPATLQSVTLRAEFDDGSSVSGESRIALVGRPISRLTLQPEGVRALPHCLKAIERADLIVIGPGSLYTSLMPVLLIREIAEAISRSGVPVALVANLMTEPGETDGYTASDFVRTIREHVPRLPIHHVLLNSAPIPDGLLRCYAPLGARRVPADERSLRSLGCGTVRRDLLEAGPKIRHDGFKLGLAVVDLAIEARRCAVRSFQ